MFHAALPQEEQQKLAQLAHQEGQSLDAFVAQLLREGIERHRKFQKRSKTARLQALARIEEHRQALLARRENIPLEVEPTELLQQIREERMQDLLRVFQENAHDCG
jgi:hypothetical protein